MSNTLLREKIEKITQDILYYQKEYYENNTSKISDSEFDALFLELKALEKKHPEYIQKNSPTQKIYSPKQTELKKAKHLVPMISLDNAFTENDLAEWEERFEKILAKNKTIDVFEVEEIREKTEAKYIVEPKFDGLGISCIYENEKFVRAVTRGDGTEGENVTQNVQTMRDHIPNIASKYKFETFEMRGEIVMKKSVFHRLNKTLEEENKKQFSTPRNAAAGSLRQLDTNITKERELSVFFYETPLKSSHSAFKTYAQTLTFFDTHNIPHSKDYFVCNSLAEVSQSIEKIETMRHDFDFDIDGAVIKINDYALREKIGSTGHHPRWAIAWKFPTIQVQTILKHVEWQVGRTGVLTPVAHLHDVMIEGVKVNRATLHNADYIEEKKLHLGDTVLLERSGEVIPKIIKSISAEAREKQKEESDERNKKKTIEIPTTCPICNTPTKKKEGEVALRCGNKNCPQVLKGKLEHFGSKKCLNITGLGKEVCDNIVEQKLITKFSEFANIYSFTRDDWGKINTFKDKSITNIISALEKSKKQPFWRIIHALGIAGVGEKTAKTLAKHYPDFFTFSHISENSLENLENIEDIGTKTAEEIIYFVENAENKMLLENLSQIFTDISQKMENKTEQKNTLDNKKFVITGSFENYSRDDVKEIIEAHGGECTGSISKKTDFLLAGEKAGSKKTKAETLNIPILTLQDFFALIS